VSQQDLVSVIMPVYNRETLVGAAIDSILSQTYPAIEVVLVNDGSTDNSLSVIKDYERKYPEKIVVIDQENQGQVASRNNAIRKANGKYIAFLDSDDLWEPTKLEEQMPLFKENVGLVYSAINNIDESGKIVNAVMCDESVRGNILPQLLVRNQMTGGTVVVLKEALDRVGLFDESFSAAENWDLWIRVCKEYDADLVNKPLVQYRVHPGNMSKDRTLMLGAKEDILNKHCNVNPESEEMARHFNHAKADLAYWKGVYHFSRAEYLESRAYFFEAHRLIPYYEDSTMRIARSYLGKFGNQLIAFVKKIKNKLL
jgi:glycosyltransferase involved in cell wall biosynthesis